MSNKCNFPDLISVKIPSVGISIPSPPSLPIIKASLPSLSVDIKENVKIPDIPKVSIPIPSYNLPSIPSLPTLPNIESINKNLKVMADIGADIKIPNIPSVSLPSVGVSIPAIPKIPELWYNMPSCPLEAV